MKLKVGQEVTWTSQANGRQRLKSGIVETVVPPKMWLKDLMSMEDAKGKFSLRTDFAGFPRDHESYLISVPGKREKSKRLLYWPRVSALDSGEGHETG